MDILAPASALGNPQRTANVRLHNPAPPHLADALFELGVQLTPVESARQNPRQWTSWTAQNRGQYDRALDNFRGEPRHGVVVGPDTGLIAVRLAPDAMEIVGDAETLSWPDPQAWHKHDNGRVYIFARPAWLPVTSRQSTYAADEVRGAMFYLGASNRDDIECRNYVVPVYWSADGGTLARPAPLPGPAADLLRRLLGVEPATEPGQTDTDDRPRIEVTTRRHEVLEDAVKSLAGDSSLYRRGHELVTVVEESGDVNLTSKTRLAGATGSPKIVALSEPNVGCLLTRNATYYAIKRTRRGEEVEEDVHPPEWLIRSVATLRHWRGVRPLLAVAECPYIRADGSIVDAAGYDAQTGTLYLPTMEFPSVPENPTQEDARAAAERLRAVVKDFPFASDADRAVWYAGLFTALLRPAIDGPVPGVAVNGNRAGCGKGLWIDTIGLIATGRVVPASNYPAEAEEAGKVKVAIALSGKPLVHFDNLDEGSTYGNSGLDSAITSQVVDDRILGTSRTTGEIPWRAFLLLSGNNVSPSKDAYRRWLLCNLVTNEEKPEERKDIEVKDLRGHVLQNRAALVLDALTILRAHAVAEWPTGDWAPLGSFEVWDRMVRGAVWFATGLDCCATLRKAAEDAPARQAKLALLQGWVESFNEDGRTTADAVKAVADAPEAHPTLANAFIHFGHGGKMVAARSLGNILRGMKGTVIGGKRFVEAGKSHGAVLWKVDALNPKSPDSEAQRGVYESGESSSGPSSVRKTSDSCTTTCFPYGNGGETHSPDSQTPLSPDDHWFDDDGFAHPVEQFDPFA